MLTVPQIASMVFVALMTVLVPLGAMLWLWRKKGGSWPAFAVGAGTFVLFALVLEQLLHTAVLNGPLGPAIQGNLWLYALYGGLAAGLFEETGRLCAFRFVLKKEKAPSLALSYGLGHGGCEAVLIVGLGMVSNLVLCATAAKGPLPYPALQAGVQAVAAAPAGTFLWALFERLSAMALHTANSVLVFAAVQRGKVALYALAVLTHAACNFLAVAANATLPVAATELLVLGFSLLVCFLAFKVWKKFWGKSPETP